MFRFIHHHFNQNYTRTHLSLVFIVALLLRLGTFFLYVQHDERYKQPDSFDYHICAVCLKVGNGMTRFDNNEAIFWRTPGYPFYLSLFYRWYDIKTSNFSDNSQPQKAAILVQIFLCSFIPLLIFFLVHALTASYMIAWIATWISVFHLGFILASCYILSDALAQIFFILFLYYFYKSFLLWFEPRKKNILTKNMLITISLAALSLALYTWIRPNGQYVVVLASAMLLLGHCSLRLKLSQIALFCLIFFAGISGWYFRNYAMTGHWFYCPMSGPILQTFCAPKILRRVSNKPLDQCIYYLLNQVGPLLKLEMERLKRVAPHMQISKELVCASIAQPWILNYPGYFLYDWTKEVLKTTFDLYASQLVAMVNKTHQWDPPEEFLSEKIMLCLYKQPMNLLMRIICWLELIFSLLLWIGVWFGCCMFLFFPLFKKGKVDNSTIKLQALWLKTGILIGGLVIMTGGFGYARLRMPADPLLITLAVTFWYYMIIKFYNSSKRSYEKTVCSVA